MKAQQHPALQRDPVARRLSVIQVGHAVIKPSVVPGRQILVP